MKRHLLIALAAVLGACNHSGLALGGAGYDGSAPSDLTGAPGIDGGPLTVTPLDLAGPRAEVGAGCTSGADCASGVCFTADPFAGGYCSLHIGECPGPGGGPGAWSPCPSGSVCINPGIAATGGTDFCLKRCGDNSECRAAEGYTCCPYLRGATTVGVCTRSCPH